MRERTVWMITIMLLVWSALCLVALNAARGHAQNLFALRPHHNAVPVSASQRDSDEEAALTGAVASADSHAGRLIVIGFMGGFVSHDDARHPEVQLAAEPRRRYSCSIYAEVFGNHHREAAHRQVLQWLDTNGDGALSSDEKRQARIIIYGHSWGASETIAQARELGRRNIPVLLTIQVDSIVKPGGHDTVIPTNVVNAVNFYQPYSLFHGCPEITAADPARTNILGNFRMAYRDQPITGGSSSWFARMFMKSRFSGPVGPPLHTFDPQKILLEPYAKCIFFRLDLTGRWPLEKDRTRGAPL